MGILKRNFLGCKWWNWVFCSSRDLCPLPFFCSNVFNRKGKESAGNLTNSLGDFDLKSAHLIRTDFASQFSQCVLCFSRRGCHTGAHLPPISGDWIAPNLKLIQSLIYCQQWLQKPLSKPSSTLLLFFASTTALPLSRQQTALSETFNTNMNVNSWHTYVMCTHLWIHARAHPAPHLFFCLKVSVLPEMNPFHALGPLPASDRCLAQFSQSFSLLTRTALHLKIFKDSRFK